MATEHKFPKRPVPAVGAVVFRRNEVLLVRRNSEPNQGRWSVPGGTLEVGETVEEAVVRETLEETSVVITPLRVFDVRDYIEKRGDSIRWHYVMINVLCGHARGKPVPASDARDARFVTLGELNQLDIAPTALEVVQTGVAALLSLGVKDRSFIS